MACKVYKEKIGALPFVPDANAKRFYTEDGGILSKVGAARQGLLNPCPKFRFVRGYREPKTPEGMPSRPCDRTLALIAADGAETPWTPGNGKPAAAAPQPAPTQPSPAQTAAATPNRKPVAPPAPEPLPAEHDLIDYEPIAKANGKPAAPPAAAPTPVVTPGFAAMRDASIPEPIQMFHLKVGDIVPAAELERAAGFFTHLYLTSKRAKLGNGVTVSKNPEHLSVAELNVMCDRMSGIRRSTPSCGRQTRAGWSSHERSNHIIAAVFNYGDATTFDVIHCDAADDVSAASQ